MTNDNYIPLQQKFDAWIEANPNFWRMFCEFTFELTRANIHKSSAWLVCNRIRWETALITRGNPYKISNDFIALLSRKFMQEFPEHQGFFQTKEMLRA